MMTKTFKGFGVFDIALPKMRFVAFAKTKKRAIELAMEYRNDGDDTVIYTIEVYRGEKATVL